ncbi:MAG: aminotransferase class I/II-fold pyridoxal phosphate-dependent enzyme [Gemmatimonadaceae bacterium]
MPELTNRFRSLPVYMLAGIPARKRELIARGVDVIDLGAGDADLAPPAAVVGAMQEAVTKPALGRYGFGLGYMPWREAIVSWMEKRFGVRFDPLREVVPLIGSKEGIGHLAFAYLERGDVAIIPEPGYLSYLGGALLSEATPYNYPLRPRTNFLVELDDVPDDVLRRAKMLYLNYPNNPTAAIAPREYLERIVRRCRELNLLLVYDNAYSELAFNGYRPPSIFEIDGAREVALEFHSLSKTYNMTGWRCGWAVGRPEFVAALAKVKSFLDTGQFMAVQAAGVAALESWGDFVPKNVATFTERRDAGIAAWRAAGFTGATPRATMYLWLELPADVDGAAFVETLLQEGVIVIPGSSFGAGGDGFFRVSLTVTPERLREAARRAGEVLARMTAPAPH